MTLLLELVRPPLEGLLKLHFKIVVRLPLISSKRQSSSTSEAAKDYRERYEELTGCSLWECPVCHQGRILVIEILPRSPHRKTAITDTS